MFSRDVIASLLYQSQQAELPIGSRDWLLAVVGAVIARPPPHGRALTLDERREVLEERLRQSGLAYGTAGTDPAVEVPDDQSAGKRAFAQLVAGLVRMCARVGWLSQAPWYTPEEGGLSPSEAIQARRGQLVALLAAAAGEAKAAAPLFEKPREQSQGLVMRLAAKAANHLTRRFLDDGGAFAGLPLHHALCAIEVRSLATLSLASFDKGVLSPAGAHLLDKAALEWRALLTELFSGLAARQEKGEETRAGFLRVIDRQRLPAREARMLRAGLADPRPPVELATAIQSEALRRFVLEQVLMLALIDSKFEPGEVAFVTELATALGTSHEELQRVEDEVEEFYRQHTEALAALRRAEIPEGLPGALTRRIQAAVDDNLDRVMQEIRETGELTDLLRKAASGTTLTQAEREKVRHQLLDLARAIPALAVFAAPGGALLLPILIKLLSFKLLPF
ncbi:MAG: hypothetical protein JST92_08815, partial [Deltaproteobacteria bacterium]|nr:hypothetical protein [Deltaproteobacteria bacterium]